MDGGLNLLKRNYHETETETSDLASKLANLKRITFEQAEALAAEKRCNANPPE
jgi:hypothetical protein